MSLRRFVPLVGLALALFAAPAFADPPAPAAPAAPPSLVAFDVDRMRVGAAAHWTPARLGRHFAFGVGWSLPQRWYDADGQLLTERSLLNPGDDLERSGLYLALRF